MVFLSSFPTFVPLVSSLHFLISVFTIPKSCYYVLSFLLQHASPQPPSPCLQNTVMPQVLGTPFQALPGWLPWDLIIAPCTFLSSQLQAMEEGLGKSTLLNAYK